MTEDQAFEAIKNVIRLENLGVEKQHAKVTKQLLEVFEEAKRRSVGLIAVIQMREQRLRYKCCSTGQPVVPWPQ